MRTYQKVNVRYWQPDVGHSSHSYFLKKPLGLEQSCPLLDRVLYRRGSTPIGIEEIPGILNKIEGARKKIKGSGRPRLMGYLERAERIFENAKGIFPIQVTPIR